MEVLSKTDKHNAVSEYYGQTLEKSDDLKTNACCTVGAYPDYIQTPLGMIHEEVTGKYYGCGLTLPQELQGRRILDLGSGSGRDCYIAAFLAGPDGHVVGIDMTDEQLDVANRYVGYHMEKFGHGRPNVEFRKGLIEKLDAAGLEDNSFDIVISNCVINLCPDKEAALREIHRVLKPGGEFYFSDVYSDRRIPVNLQDDPVLYGECLSGALYEGDFIRLARRQGFNDPREVTRDPITIENRHVQTLVGSIKFDSITYRLFKLPELEDACEDFGQAVRYKGTLRHSPDVFELDAGHRFEKGRAYPVCGNTFNMLCRSRFAGHFDYFGDASVHFGRMIDCAPVHEADRAAGTDCGC
ncbi:methyltransferase domain-containing protein [Pontiella agarivorans]|uniref:Arsenite methyltransferase n=1 Tax=Pontiella agarivorans TaxID=3038953 RepID=A0ABU5MVV4_9BACT|nr:methyltransferase domain-containing protein [Pontiella agarivorans]MDZ8118216.1 methyltransferase domain-containing protein [Pontiella agarivorans]